MVVAEKHVLTVAELEAQSALELPDREMLTLVVIKNVLNNLRIRVDVRNNNVAVQVCAIVQALNAILWNGNKLTCTIRQ
jgi:hypothetical protein